MCISACLDTDFATNRWGMRDRDYDLAKSSGTFRIALLGSSNVMGWGVPQEDVFETILEARLNDDRPEDVGLPTTRSSILRLTDLVRSAKSRVLQNAFEILRPTWLFLSAILMDPIAQS